MGPESVDTLFEDPVDSSGEADEAGGVVVAGFVAIGAGLGDRFVFTGGAGAALAEGWRVRVRGRA